MKVTLNDGVIVSTCANMLQLRYTLQGNLHTPFRDKLPYESNSRPADVLIQLRRPFERIARGQIYVKHLH